MTANGAERVLRMIADQMFGQRFGDLVKPLVNLDAGRAFSAGKLPTMPALHWAMTSFGLETMKSGAPMTGT